MVDRSRRPKCVAAVKPPVVPRRPVGRKTTRTRLGVRAAAYAAKHAFATPGPSGRGRSAATGGTLEIQLRGRAILSATYAAVQTEQQREAADNVSESGEIRWSVKRPVRGE